MMNRKQTGQVAESITSWARAWIISLGVLLVAGCTDSLSWTEDVRLPDGRVVVLQRYVEFSRRGGNAEKFQRISFTHPTSGVAVTWENPKQRRENAIGGILDPVSLFEGGGNMFLLTTPAYGNDLIYFNCPDPPYFLFEYGFGGWASRPLSQIPVQTVPANLTIRIGLEHSREALAKARGHLGVEHTSNHRRVVRDERGRVGIVPYVMDFRSQPEQTFRVYENCNKPLNYLVFKEDLK